MLEPEVTVPIQSSQRNMLLAIFLLFLSSESTVKCQTTPQPSHSTTWTTVTNVAGFTEKLSPLQLVATPFYPVVAGQTVNLHCSALTTPASVIWSWQRLENLAWREVGRVNNLTLTEPWQSGPYRCSAETRFSQSVSYTITVLIIATQPTVGEKIGIAALVLSLLALIVALTILCLLVWQRFGDTRATCNTAAKASPGPGKAPKGCLPQTQCHGDVYMNYTSTNQAYSDLDPTNRTEDSVYSSLS
ncbi:uncharacterized protein LOC118286194 isoform X1 [Scophthalmus maximus]|uniref:uncharacterized protein LOC118286194 isoform X1 n=1 Tax=Scophthalmus maximus TaxID=52904 RepID=UPI0015E06146|nr:uncharacterized protein LOC118286194 isoform X1 [Scophthalmus maximus]